MDEGREIDFLFDISNEMKNFYETPVILLTHEDFADNIFNTMCSIRTKLLDNCRKDEVIDLIVDFHLKWLRAVSDIENFKKRSTELPREYVYQAISYTIDAMSNRLKYFQIYIEKYRSILTVEKNTNMHAEMEIIEEMHKEVTQGLLEKLKCFRSYASDDEFLLKLNDSIDEILNWLDKIYDNLAVQLAKIFNVNMPHLPQDLYMTLQQVIDEIATARSSSAQRLLEELKQRGAELSTMIRSTADHSLEIGKVVEKINVLENRIKRLQNEQSSAVMALQHKKEYLQKRLLSLENLKMNIKTFQKQTDIQIEYVDDEEICVCEDFYQLRIFNHLLPQSDREHLVTELCYIWDLAVFGKRTHKSVISILSAADIREEFYDELGTYYVDEHSRKNYKNPDEDILYQPDENNKLVPLSDDADHVYFFDECGRYYVDQNNRQRVYKAHSTSSEYMMDSSGVLLKIKEECEGSTYYYDNYGRYYKDENGKHIYRELDSVTEYENDGLGNLVRIRSHLDIFDPCPDDVNVTEDCKYLKKTVGNALRECIAELVLQQPLDPIKHLSARLDKYRENIEARDRRSREKEQLDVEREIKLAEERAAAEKAALEAAMLEQGGSEASYDSNLLNYASQHPIDFASDVTSTK